MTEKQETTYSMEQRAKLWAVGGGKGGVGKSFLTTNIGVLLAKEGKRVVLMDLDLGGANLHTCLGVTDLDRGVSDFLMRRYEELEEALVPTQVPNLFLLSGAQDSLNIANPKYAQKIRLLRELKKIEAKESSKLFKMNLLIKKVFLCVFSLKIIQNDEIQLKFC